MTEGVKDTGIRAFTIRGGSLEVGLTNYGAAVMSVITPDRHGVKANVVAGFSDPLQYLGDHPYLGVVVGRFTNRISGGRFPLDGQEVQLTMNEKVNQLHGGFEGFSHKTWKVVQQDEHSITFSYRSPDGEEGFPGNLDVSVRYSVSMNNALLVEYSARTDKPTIVSLTNHSYFNLSGFSSLDIYEHELEISARSYTRKNENNSSTGEIVAVKNTPLDFTNRRPIGARIAELVTDMGYDHNYVLDDGPAPAARLDDPASGRFLNIYTDQPGLQVYTANWWDGSVTGQHGKPYLKHGAVALETQALPDAPNHPSFPSAVLRPGEEYKRYTIYEFGAD